jgi:integrase
MGRPSSVPSYRLHRQSGQAVVTLRDPLTDQRKDVLLGAYNTPDSRSEYARVIAEWEATGRTLAAGAGESDITVNELLLAYWQRHVVSYYVKNGKPTTQQHRFKQALKPVRELYGHTLVKDFGPLALKAVRQKLVDHRYVRRYVNQMVGCIKQCFKWGVAEELVPPSVLHGLQAVAGLREGRCDAKESRRVKPVAWRIVEEALPFMSRQVAAMVQLQRFTGMRSGEVVTLRACDIDRSGPVWFYRPMSHKTQHHGKDRVVALGPQAQTIIKEYLKLDTQAYLFSPAEAESERRRRLTEKRKTALSCGNRVGSNRTATPEKKPGERYTSGSYQQSIAKAIEKANAKALKKATEEAKKAGQEPPAADTVFVPHWHPHQLRHLHASEVRKKYGLEAAQVALGHAQASITEIYAERNLGLASRVAAEIG